MPITSAWFDEAQSIVYLAATGDWSLEEYREQFLDAYHKMLSVSHPVGLIVDMSATTLIPRQFMSLGSFIARHRAPNLEFTIMVGFDAFAARLVGIMPRLVPGLSAKVRMVDTMDEAVGIIRGIRV